MTAIAITIIAALVAIAGLFAIAMSALAYVSIRRDKRALAARLARETLFVWNGALFTTDDDVAYVSLEHPNAQILNDLPIDRAFILLMAAGGWEALRRLDSAGTERERCVHGKPAADRD